VCLWNNLVREREQLVLQHHEVVELLLNHCARKVRSDIDSVKNKRIKLVDNSMSGDTGTVLTHWLLLLNQIPDLAV
jgi:hypothetical protein